jgi:sugar (pentulose or hexulose) kinase
LIASLVPAPVLRPPSIGQASLRGAAVYAWRALGHDASEVLEKLLANADTVERVQDESLKDRYERFKELRTEWGRSRPLRNLTVRR